MEKLNYKFAAWISALGLVLLIVLYVLEFEYIGNTIGYGNLIVKSLFVALIVGVYLGWRFHNKGEEQVDRIRIWSACLLLPLFFAPLLGSLTNRLLPRSETVYHNFEFIEEKPFAASLYGFLKGEEVEADGCYLFIYYYGEIHRLKRSKCEFYQNESGDTISLPITKGLWGYEVVGK